MGWVTFVCARTQRGLFKRILSWRLFSVVDQLTMIMYVIQPMLIISQMAGVRERVYYNHDTHVSNYLVWWVTTDFLNGSILATSSFEPLTNFLLLTKLNCPLQLKNKYNNYYIFPTDQPLFRDHLSNPRDQFRSSHHGGATRVIIQQMVVVKGSKCGQRVHQFP